MNIDIMPYITVMFLFGIVIYSEIMNRKQRKQIEEWRKSWF